MNNYVPPEGNPSSPFWAIGEAPGAIENRLLIPFKGPAGQYLDKGFRDAAILRSELFLWNVFSRRPPNNDVEYYFKDKKRSMLTFEGEEMLRELEFLVKKHRPNLILALGGTALWALTGKPAKGSISKWRGSLLNCILCEGVKVYPAYHPSFVMRLMQEQGNPFQKTVGGKEKKLVNVYPTFVKDLRRAKEQSGYRDFPEEGINFIIPRSVEEAVSYLKAIPLGATVRVASDIETIHFPDAIELPVVTRVGFAWRPDEGISIPFTMGGGVCWTLEEWAEILIAISEVYLSDRKIIFQNGFYDLTVLGKIFGLRLREGNILDTMVQQHCVYPHMPKGLDFQCSVYTWAQYYKDDRKKHKAGQLTEDALSIYNTRDCCRTREIQPVTERDIAEFRMEEGLARSISLYPSLLSMMLRGVRVDVEAKKEMQKRFFQRKEELNGEIAKIAGEVVNPNSYKQMKKLLYYTLSFPEQINRKTKKVTTDVVALSKLEKTFQHPIFKLLRNFRKYSKLYGTYAKMPISKGRVHTTYDPTGTSTWRLSSYESPLGVGGNLQNIPKRDEEGREIRKIFIPDEGFEMGRADLKQAEDRVVVWRAGDEEAIENYLAGGDPHWQNAIKLFRLDPDTPYNSKNPEHYRLRNKISKHAKHAGNYDVGPIQLRDMLRTMADFWEYDTIDCKHLLDAQRRAAPFVQMWKKWVRDQIYRDRTLVTFLGRKRIFYGRISDDLVRKALAFEPQSTVGELLSMNIRDCHRELESKDFNILMNVHDEIVFQYRKGMRDYYLPKVKAIMEKRFTVKDIYGKMRELIIPCDFQVGPNWLETKEVEVK